MALSQGTLDFIKEVSTQTAVTIFLTNGVKLSGTITRWEEDSYGLSRDGITQVILHQAIGTVMPQDALGSKPRAIDFNGNR